MEEYTPPEPVDDDDLILNARSATRPIRVAFLRHVAELHDVKKIVFDFTPRTHPVAEVEAALQAAGLTPRA